MNGEQMPLDLRGGSVPYARVGGLEVNEYGVVVGGHEVFRLDRGGRWEGLPIAELRVAPHPYRPGWIWAASWSLPGEGHGGPLCIDGPLSQVAETREDAFTLARMSVVGGLERYLDQHRPSPETRALVAWLNKGCPA